MENYKIALSVLVLISLFIAAWMAVRSMKSAAREWDDVVDENMGMKWVDEEDHDCGCEQKAAPDGDGGNIQELKPYRDTQEPIRGDIPETDINKLGDLPPEVNTKLSDIISNVDEMSRYDGLVDKLAECINGHESRKNTVLAKAFIANLKSGMDSKQNIMQLVGLAEEVPSRQRKPMGKLLMSGILEIV